MTGCPPGCTNKDYGTCPRCYDETALGCPHGPLCDGCKEDTYNQTAREPDSTKSNAIPAYNSRVGRPSLDENMN